jgi:hypothetical protein
MSLHGLSRITLVALILVRMYEVNICLLFRDSSLTASFNG